jgi:hypothetical protein
MNKVYELNPLLHRQGIFVPDDLCDRFDQFKQLCTRAIVERKTDHGARVRSGSGFGLEFSKNGESEFATLKIAVRQRLLRA